MDIVMVINYDWEDIVVGLCGENSCIYIVDFGYRGGFLVNIIYRVQELDIFSFSLILVIDLMVIYM